MWYMGLDENNRPNGWDTQPWGNAIEVSSEVRAIHELHPEYTWDGMALIEPPAPPAPPVYIPTSVSMRQARLQLAVLGSYQTVNQAVTSMGELAQIEWEYAATVDRGNLLTAAMVALLGWTEQQTDEYFIAASQL